MFSRSVRPPHAPLPAPAPGRFHSVLGQSLASGGAVDHREYVVFDKAQALPLAVVTYRHRPSCACSRCSN